MMKQAVMFLLVFCMIIGLSACNLSLVENQTFTNPNDEEQPEKIFEHGVVENGLVYYRLPTLPGAVGIDEDYDAYSPEYGYTEEMLNSQGIGKDKLDFYLQMSGKDLMIVPKGEILGSPTFKISIHIKDEKNYGVDNLKDLDETKFKEHADSLVQGFSLDGNPIAYSVYKNEKAKYVVFDWMPMGLERRYATVINGKMVYFIVVAEGNPISADQEKTVEAIIDTLQY